MTPDADPVDPPVPVPDVPGADVAAGAEGLPPRSALSPRQRMVLEAAAVSDLALRTAVASVLTTTVTPAVIASSVRFGSERDSLRFYAELGAERDPAKSFPVPTELPRVSSRPANRLAERLSGATVDNISFPSSFRAINPAMRAPMERLGIQQRRARAALAP